MAFTAEPSAPIKTATDISDDALVRKIFFRLVPFLFVLYIIAYVDRVNVGFAKLSMNALPWFSESIFGIGSGIFFIGYFLFEVPSNLILQRVGARKWIARIMVSWGLVAMAMLFAHSRTSFYILRFTLGLAEAGFFPGVLLYLTYWFTARERARVIALFMTANAVSFIFGGPLSGALIDMPSLFGLAGWQQMFVFEGLPAVILGIVVLFYLPDNPQAARWLAPHERERIAARIAAEQAASDAAPVALETEVTASGPDMVRPPAPVLQGQPQVPHATLGAVLSYPATWLLCAVFFFLVVGMYGITMWLPQIISAWGKLSGLQIGLLSAVPYLAAGSCMVANATHSDRTGERRFHVAVPALCGATGLVGCALFTHPFLSLLSLTLAAGGMWSINGPFWSIVPQVLRRRFGVVGLAGGIAFVNSVGNLGGFIGPMAIGQVKEITHNFKAGLLVLAASVLCGSILVLFTPRNNSR